MRFLVFLFVLTTTSAATNWLPKATYPGQIIYFNDTLEVNFKRTSSFLEMEADGRGFNGKYERLVYFDSLDTKHVLNPNSKLRIVVIDMPQERIELFNVPYNNGIDGYPGNRVFALMRRIRDGEINLYGYTDRIHEEERLPESDMYQQGRPLSNGVAYLLPLQYASRYADIRAKERSHFVVQKNNGPFFTVDLMNLADIKEFFSDCPQINVGKEVRLIQEGGIRWYVDQYNMGCGNALD